jgi:hypothetical protein
VPHRGPAADWGSSPYLRAGVDAVEMPFGRRYSSASREAAAMPIGRVLKEAAFDPEEVQAIVAAYEAALAKLGLKDGSDPAAEMVAKKIVEIARDGERHPERLSDLVVTSLQG